MNPNEPGMRLDHVGIAVRSLGDAALLWGGTLGLAAGGVEAVESMGVRVQKFESANTSIELLEDATGGQGVVGRFLAKNGPGVHHLSFEVPDLEAATARLAAAGYRLLYEAPRPGAGGWRVNFLHPKDAQGVLVELMEAP